MSGLAFRRKVCPPTGPGVRAPPLLPFGHAAIKISSAMLQPIASEPL
jgi:hypothetical protein